MWTPWEWASASQAAALANARTASTELGRRRVERDDVELFLAGALAAGGPEVRTDAVRRAGAG